MGTQIIFALKLGHACEFLLLKYDANVIYMKGPKLMCEHSFASILLVLCIFMNEHEFIKQ